MKKILFISHKITRGGAQLLLKNIVAGLKDKIDCHVWAPLDGELKQEYEASQIPLYIRDFEVDRINREQSIEFNTATRKQIEKIIEKYSKNRKKLAIRCAGTITTKLLEEFDFSKVNLIGIFDNNSAIFGRDIKGYKIYPVDELDKFEVNSVLIAHNQPKFLKQELVKKKIKVYDIFDSSKNKNSVKYIINILKPVLFIAKINPDIVFVNNAMSFWAVIAGKILGKKVIWGIHEAFEPKTFRVFPHSLYLLSFKLADRFVFPSHATYEYYKELIPEHKVNMIHNGVDIEEIEKYKNSLSAVETRKELNIPDNHKIICNIGTFDEIKGQLYLIKAAINLLKSSENYTFIIVGANNSAYSQNLANLIDNSGFKDNFRIILVTKEPYKFLNIADIYVTSSFKETFCIANIEAMIFKKPVIATNVCGIPETIEHNLTGILIPATDMEKHIEQNIKHLLENPDLVSKLTKNAYNNVKESFTIQKMLEKYEKLLDF